MANITNVKLIVGKISGSDNEFVQVSFDLSLTIPETNYGDGYYLRAYLYEINGNLDNWHQNYWGGISTKPSGTDSYDQSIGAIFNELYHPSGATEHIVRQREWNFPAIWNPEGEEIFRAIISIVPRVPGITPRAVRSPELKIDIG